MEVPLNCGKKKNERWEVDFVTMLSKISLNM